MVVFVGDLVRASLAPLHGWAGLWGEAQEDAFGGTCPGVVQAQEA